MTDTTLEQLTDLMQREKHILLTGALWELEETNRNKEKLLAEFDFEDVAPEAIQGFVGMVEELRGLSKAALEGFQSARAGYVAREAARSKLASYDAAGAPRVIESHVGGAIRRA